MKVVFVCAYGADKSKVRDYLDKIDRQDIRVEKHGYLQKDDEVAEYDVQPPQSKFLLDFGGNVVRFGSFQDNYKPMKIDLDKNERREHLESYKLNKSDMLFKNQRLTIASQKTINRNIQEVKDSIIESERLSNVGIFDLLDLWYIEDDYTELTMIYLAFINNAYCYEMEDKWGKPTYGYSYQKYNRENDSYSQKEVSGFYNSKTADWLMEENRSFIEDYPDEEERSVKALKTRMASIANMRDWKKAKDGIITKEELMENQPTIKKSVYEIRFFGEFLRQKKEEEMEEIEDMQYQKIETNNNGGYDIFIESDNIPF
jgi:hypothetical protein